MFCAHRPSPSCSLSVPLSVGQQGGQALQTSNMPVSQRVYPEAQHDVKPTLFSFPPRLQVG